MVPAEMYRFLVTPRWLGFHLLVAVVIVTMVNLGFWQLRRLDERKAFNAQLESRMQHAPAPLDDVLSVGADPSSVEWRQVTASGTYLPQETFTVVNRSQDGIGGGLVGGGERPRQQRVERHRGEVDAGGDRVGALTFEVEATPYPAPVTLPELDDGPHLSYAIQWFTFSAAVVVGWVLAVRKSIRTRQAAARRAAAAASPAAADATAPTSSA